MDSAEILFGGRWKVGGRWLGPITVGHGAMLEAFNLLSVKDARHFALASLLLERPWREFLKTISSRWLGVRIALRLGKATRPNLEVMQSMINSALRLPEMMYKPDSRQVESGAPSIYRVRVFLVERLGLSPDEAMETPLLEAIADMAVALEMDGTARILGDDEKRIAKLNAEAIRARN